MFVVLNAIQLYELYVYNQTDRWVLYACSLQID